MSNFMFSYTYTCIYTIIQIIISKLYLFIYALLCKNIKQDIDIELYFSYTKDKMKIDRINNISILTYNIKQLLFWVLYYDIDKIIDYLLCSNKGFVMIKLNHKGYCFNIVNTHLQSDYQNKLYTSIRKHQITTILKVIDKNIPTILVGDLNIKCFSPEFKSYSWKNYYHKKDEYTCPDEKAILDYIIPLYTKTLNVIQYIIDTHIHLSDHKPVICQLRFHK